MRAMPIQNAQVADMECEGFCIGNLTYRARR